MDKRKTSWIQLCNCLYFISCQYDSLRYLESPIFEPFEDLDSSIQVGLSNDSLQFYLTNEWIDIVLMNELKKFRDFTNSIDSNLWNPIEFDVNIDWGLARDWAISLKMRLGIDNEDWIDPSIIIYTK